MAGNIFKREFENIWGPPGSYRSFYEIFSQAQAKGMLTLIFYLQNNTGRAIIIALLLMVAWIYLRSLKTFISRKIYWKMILKGSLCSNIHYYLRL